MSIQGNINDALFTAALLSAVSKNDNGGNDKEPRKLHLPECTHEELKKALTYLHYEIKEDEFKFIATRKRPFGKDEFRMYADGSRELITQSENSIIANSNEITKIEDELSDAILKVKHGQEDRISNNSIYAYEQSKLSKRFMIIFAIPSAILIITTLALLIGKLIKML